MAERAVRVQDDKMTALVSENTMDSTPVRSRCACKEVKLCVVQLTTELGLSVDKLKEEKKGRNDVSAPTSMST